MSDAKPVVVMHGPESTGKSVLGAKLARVLGGLYVPEYGRTYCEIHGNQCDAFDLHRIATGQIAAINAAKTSDAPLVVSDTDAVLTDVWAQMMLGRPLFETAPPISGDLYLLTDIDLPFVEDQLRVYRDAADRRAFFQRSQHILDQLNLDYVTLSGEWDQREIQALKAIYMRFPRLKLF